MRLASLIFLRLTINYHPFCPTTLDQALLGVDMALRWVGSTLKGKARAVLPIMQDPQHIVPVAQYNSLRTRWSSTLGGPSSIPSANITHPIAEVDSTQSALALLRSQPTHYVVASIAGRTLVLHPRDLVTLPRLNDVEIGDVIELDRIHEVGSRDYTLRAQDPMSTRPTGVASLTRTSTASHQLHLVGLLQRALIQEGAPSLDASVDANGHIKESQSWAARLKPSGLAHIGAVLAKDTVRVRCTVVEHTKGRMEFIVKKKRRKGYKKTIKHKQTYTRLRVEGIHLSSAPA